MLPDLGEFVLQQLQSVAGNGGALRIQPTKKAQNVLQLNRIDLASTHLMFDGHIAGGRMLQIGFHMVRMMMVVMVLHVLVARGTVTILCGFFFCWAWQSVNIWVVGTNANTH